MLEMKKNHDLSAYNTFHLPVKAAMFYELTDAMQLIDIIQEPDFQKEKTLWLGGGSNIIFTQDYAGLVVHLANKGITETHRENGKVWIKAEAGEIWHDFVQKTLQMGLSGLENLSLIYGTVGASPVQNIGAYGVEVKDRIHAVHCFDLQFNQFVTLSNAECEFAYRESIFKQAGKGRYIIVSVEFILDTEFKPHIQYGDLAQVLAENCPNQAITAQNVADAVCQIRRSKLPNPDEWGNVGSFFKNPIVSAEHAQKLHAQYPNMPTYPQADGSLKLAAGWLIDQCGLKGKSMGGAAVHEKQALVLINKNNASVQDIRDLSDFICTQVWEKFGVQLHAEANWI